MKRRQVETQPIQEGNIHSLKITQKTTTMYKKQPDADGFLSYTKKENFY